ncbi:MAG: DHH family phosphoesterase, partial [Bdellovibrionaceae bacterium]|nr:DHH family phosphoesterase [Pseudobdellovibrionaceae bacterium]
MARGWSNSSSLADFLHPKVSNIRPAESLLNMKVAVDRLVQAYRNNERICLYTDFDLDGSGGLALLKLGMEGLGYKNLISYQPRRLTEGYGFHAHAVDIVASQGASLIVTVDVGITAISAVRKARELGLDVIITDHHLPGEELPQALAVINPNQPGDNSGLGYLSGAGVAFYLLRALKRALQNAGLARQDFDLREVLEFFTISTLTDMVPLIGDNRALVRAGLKCLEGTRKPGLRALLETLNLSGRPLT